MLLQEVNPFLRCAVRFRYSCVSSVRCPADARILYVIDGSGTLSVEGAAYALCPGTLALINAGFVYRMELREPLELIALNFDYTYARKDLTLVLEALPAECAATLEKDRFEDCPPLSAPLILQHMFQVQSQLEDIISAFQTQKRYYQEEASCLLRSLLIQLARAALLTKPKTNATANQLIQYLQTHYSENLTAERIAAEFNYHPCHINRIMRSATGTTVHNYLIGYRVSVAKRLLSSTELTVSQIAGQLGFQNGAYFSNLFKKAVGCSPSDYRIAQRESI